ncbi:MAG: sodium:solute symporter family protein [Acetobacterales bacterium]
MSWIWVAIVAYMLLQLGIGVWASRRVAGETDYLVAGRRLGLSLVSISVFATWFGAETVMGSAAAIADEGLSGGRADPFGYMLCLVAMGLLLAFQMRQRGYVTLADFFRDRYGRSAEVLAVLLLVPASIIWASAQLLAFGQILVVATDIDLDAALLAAAALVIVYTVLGGLLGDVITDVVQGGVLVIGLVVLLVMVFAHAGGVAEGLGRIEASQLRFVAEGEPFLSRFDAWMIPIVGSLVSQEAISRFLAARDAPTARNACFAAAGIYLVVGMIPVTLALVGTHMDLGIGHRDEFLPELAKTLLPPVLFVIFIGALMSAILSTVDSTVLAASSLITHNLIAPLRPAMGERGRLLAARITVVCAGVAAYLVAAGGDNIFGLVRLASSFGTAGISVAVVFGLWTTLGGRTTELITLVIGALALPFSETVLEADAPYMLSVGAALATYLLLSLFDRPAAVSGTSPAGRS